MNVTTAKDIARSWDAPAGLLREAAREVLAELTRVEAQLERTRREYAAEMARTVRP